MKTRCIYNFSRGSFARLRRGRSTLFVRRFWRVLRTWLWPSKAAAAVRHAGHNHATLSVMAMSLLVGIVVGAFGPHYSALTAVVFGKPGLAKWLFMSFTTDPTPPT